MVVFICGLSGIGKSSLIEYVVTNFPNVRHVRASDLLASAGKPIRNLRTSDVLHNQLAFVKLAAAEIRRSTHVLIDGHLLIESLDGPISLPDNCLDALQIDGVIIVTADAEQLFSRRVTAGLCTASINELAELMSTELENAKRLAQRRRVGFATIQSGDRENFIAQLGEMVTNYSAPAGDR
ncbi:MAG: AAA family ATPase [Exiguobacterium sp.]|nr:AAA family ATPase [Exiguobacterium sp.]